MAETVEDDIDETYAHNVFIVEKELSGAAATGENSYLLKFFNQVEGIKKMHEEEEKQQKKHKGRTFR